MEYIYIRMNDQNQVSKESSQVASTIGSINILAQEGGGDSKLFPGEVLMIKLKQSALVAEDKIWIITQEDVYTYLRFSPGFPLRLFGT
jgi:hypothetical protein